MIALSTGPSYPQSFHGPTAPCSQATRLRAALAPRSTAASTDGSIPCPDSFGSGAVGADKIPVAVDQGHWRIQRLQLQFTHDCESKDEPSGAAGEFYLTFANSLKGAFFAFTLPRLGRDLERSSAAIP